MSGTLEMENKPEKDETDRKQWMQTNKFECNKQFWNQRFSVNKTVTVKMCHVDQGSLHSGHLAESSRFSPSRFS